MAGPRAAEARPIEFEVGIQMDETARMSANRWRDGNWVRWDGETNLAQKMGGYTRQSMLDPDGNAALYYGRARSNHEWESLDGQRWVAFGTQCKLYLLNQGTLYDITPLRRQSYLTDPFATTNGSPIVTVTDASHDAQAGDHVRFTGASTFAGITIVGEYTVTAVLGPDTYTITHTANANATTTGGGAVTAYYDISCGLESDGVLYGYGTGDYGEEAYGTPRSTSTFTGKARVWSLDNWGEDLVASPNGETIYVWRWTTGPQSRAVEMTGAPGNVEHILVGPDNRHIIALGTNLVSTGVQDRMFVRWNVGDDYNDWVSTNSNDAGSKRLDLGSRLITGLKSNRVVLVWSDKAMYACSPVGGNDVYSFEPIGRCSEIVSKNAAVDVDGTAYFMGQDDFYIYDGTLRPLPCSIKKWVFGDKSTAGIARAYQSKVHCSLRREFNEIWWYFPSALATENDRIAIYNYALQCWYVGTNSRESSMDLNGYYGYPIGFSGGRLYLHEYGVDAIEGSTSAITAYLESWEASGNEVPQIAEMIPDFPTLVGSVNVTLFGRNYPQESRVNGPVRNVTSATKTIKPRFSKKQIGFRVESSAVADNWRMGQWQSRAVGRGRRY